MKLYIDKIIDLACNNIFKSYTFCMYDIGGEQHMDISDFLMFIKQAGEIAVNNQKKLSAADIYYKDNYVTGIVTKIDQEISELFATFIKSYCTENSYAIIDEEIAIQNPDNPFTIFDSTEYQFILDPIDGTLTYACQTPLYSISLGILKRGKPYMGILYAPASNEVVYHDGINTHWLKDAFLPTQQDVVLEPRTISSSLIFKNARTIDLQQSENVKGNLELNLWSCVLHNLYILTGRGKAAFISAMFWDIAGAWAALSHLGYKIYNTENGQEMTEVSERHFKKDFKFISPHLICKPENFDEIMNLIKK